MDALGNDRTPTRSNLMRFCRLSTIFLLAVSILGCGKKEPRADIVIINGAEPQSLDPAIITGQPDGRAAGALFEGLTRLNPKTATAEPAIAERWDVSTNGKLYTFHLRKNAKWSTGAPITSEDFIYSWRRVVDPLTASEYAGQLFFVQNAEEISMGKIKDLSQLGVRAIDTHTLRVELNAPCPFFLDLCAFRTLSVVPRAAIEKHGDRWLLTPPVPTSGPYALESWRIRDKIRIRKNPYYWDAANVQNEIIDLLPIDQQTTALSLYTTGQVDIIWDKGLVPNELLDVLRNRPDMHTFDYLGTEFIRYNVTKKPFDDPRVRKALALAIDKQRLVDKITKGGEKIASSYTPPGTAHYLPPAGLGHDPSLAKKLLAEAGFPNGKGFPNFIYLTSNTKTSVQLAVEIQEMWQRELGIHCEIAQKEWKVYLTDQSELNYDVSRSGWVGDYNDPNTFLDMFMSNNGNNRTGWKNPRYDQLMRDANQITDLNRRAEMLRDAETLLVHDDLPIIPLFFRTGVNFFDPAKFEGIYFNLLDEHPLWPIRRKR